MFMYPDYFVYYDLDNYTNIYIVYYMVMKLVDTIEKISIFKSI